MNLDKKIPILGKQQKIGVFILLGIGLGILISIISFIIISNQEDVFPLDKEHLIVQDSIQSEKGYRTEKKKRKYLYKKNESRYRKGTYYENNYQVSNISQTYPLKQRIVFDINEADTLDLQSLRGIGEVYARRICRYRDKLGGYVNMEQLKEVYGMSNSLYSNIIPYLKIENIELRKININMADIKQLCSHPYIDFYLAKAIIKYRVEIKSFTSLEQLKVIHLLDEETFNKILPYLEL